MAFSPFSLFPCHLTQLLGEKRKSKDELQCRIKIFSPCKYEPADKMQKGFLDHSIIP
jgi:hypothetical protein